MKRLSVLLVVCLLSTVCSAEILLNDTWADGSRIETNRPTESALWVSSPADVTTSVGFVKQAMATSSRRLHTYFAPDGSPVSLGIGEKLVATINFKPEGGLTSTTSKNFRFGLFNDPTNGQMASDSLGDSGTLGGIVDPWMDATGYGVQFSLSPDSSAGSMQVGKRTSATTASLLGTSGAFTWATGTGKATNLSLDTLYTMTLVLDYQAVDKMLATFTFSNGATVIGTNSLLDTGTAVGGKPIFTKFDMLHFRLSGAAGTANVVDFQSITIERIVPEPATMLLLGLGGLVLRRRK